MIFCCCLDRRISKLCNILQKILIIVYEILGFPKKVITFYLITRANCFESVTGQAPVTLHIVLSNVETECPGQLLTLRPDSPPQSDGLRWFHFHPKLFTAHKSGIVLWEPRLRCTHSGRRPVMTLVMAGSGCNEPSPTTRGEHTQFDIHLAP